MLNFKSTQENINCNNNGYYFTHQMSKDTICGIGGNTQKSVYSYTAGFSMSYKKAEATESKATTKNY